MAGKALFVKYAACDTIMEILSVGQPQPIVGGCSAADVVRIVRPTQNWYLKISETDGHDELLYEKRVLEWLHDKTQVAVIVDYGQCKNYDYLVTTEIEGADCCEISDRKEMKPGEIVELLANGLRSLHELPIEHCPFDQRVRRKLKDARSNIDENRVDESDFDEERQSMKAEEIYEYLWENVPPENDLVFNHGDYCLPNVIVKSARISGFVDLGAAGVSDRYNDLAIATRSVGYNLGTEYESLFLEIYGVRDIDYSLVDYYRAVDELF